MDPISIDKIRAMNKYSKGRRRQPQLLPTLSLYIYLAVATFVLCLLLTSPAWFPGLCSALASFFLTTLPGLFTAFLLSPRCLFVVGNLIIAFLVGESRLAPRRRDDDGQPSLVNDIHEEHVKKNAAAAVEVADHSAFVGAVVGKEVEVQVQVKEEEEQEEEEEEGNEEELHTRVEDFIARVKRQRKLELKSFFDVDR